MFYHLKKLIIISLSSYMKQYNYYANILISTFDFEIQG